jgi:hypothetical protein
MLIHIGGASKPYLVCLLYIKQRKPLRPKSLYSSTSEIPNRHRHSAVATMFLAISSSTTSISISHNTCNREYITVRTIIIHLNVPTVTMLITNDLFTVCKYPPRAKG